jgi:hypothetical protein
MRNLMSPALIQAIESGQFSKVAAAMRGFNEFTLKEAAYLIGVQAYVKRAQAEHIIDGLQSMRELQSGSEVKLADNPWGTLIRRSVAPAVLGGAAAYAVSPDDPEIQKRNMMVGGAIGAGGGLLHTLHKGIQANPQVAQQMFHAL